jgi:predicted metal-dependent hydrolase
MPLLQYLRRDFHPNDLDDADEMAQWLQAQREAYSIVA